jgi:hypothetical protein
VASGTSMFLGEGMVWRRLIVRAPDVAFVKSVVEAHDGLAQVLAVAGGDLVLAAAAEREEELLELVRDLARELDGILEDEA